MMQNSKLIVYYSWVGSTKVVAQFIARQTNIDLVSIEEVKPRPLRKIMSAAMGGFLGFKSKLKPMDYEMKHIDTLLLGAQIWAGKTAPAINTFLSKATFRNKKVWLFMTLGDEKLSVKVIESIKKRIEKKGGSFEGYVSFQTHWEPEVNLPITEEEIREKAVNWLKENNLFMA
jgi:flavodoxin